MLLLLVAGLCPPAAAAEDGRFTVVIPLTEHDDWKQKVDDGMAVVLDRLLPQKERAQVTLAGVPYLLRATPSPQRVRFQFRPLAVIAALERRALHPLKVAPRLALQIAMHDASGVEMAQTETLLRDEARTIAERWGIDLREPEAAAPDAMALRLDWRWMDDQWLALTVVADDGRLVALGGESRIDAGAPMEQLHARLQRILLRARDAARSEREQNPRITQPVAVPEQAGEQTVTLTIMQPATLAEQVGLEQVLRAVPQVKAITPLVLSRQWQRYRLTVRDTAWVVGWFANRGMQAVLTPDGWEVR